MAQDIGKYRDERTDCYWVKYTPGFMGDTPIGGQSLRLVRFDDFGHHHYLPEGRPWDDAAMTLAEAQIDFHRAEIEAADAALEERKRRAPDKSDEKGTAAPMDEATRKFLSDEY